MNRLVKVFVCEDWRRESRDCLIVAPLVSFLANSRNKDVCLPFELRHWN